MATFYYTPAYIEDKLLKAGSTFTVNVRAYKDTKVHALSLRLLFPGDLLQVDSAACPIAGTQFDWNASGTPGLLATGMYSTSLSPVESGPNGTPLVAIVFRCLRDTKPGEILGVKFDADLDKAFRAYDENSNRIDFDLTSNMITVTGPAPYADLSLPTVAERKAAQHYSTVPIRPYCGNCDHIQKKEGDSSYPRCGLGNFAVSLTGVCGLHKLTF